MFCAECLRVWFVELPRSVASVTAGTVLGIWPAIAFSLITIMITFFRFPMYVYRIFKVALSTVLLQTELRILVIILLPLAQLLSLVIVMVAALVGSIFYWVYQTSARIYKCLNCFEPRECVNCFEPWEDVWKGIDQYQRIHQEFSAQLVQYGHPSGIPIGWDGTRYNLPLSKLVLGLILAIYGVLSTLIGFFIVLSLKYLPINWFIIFEILKCIIKLDLYQKVIFFPFYLLGIVGVLILSPVLYGLGLFIAVLLGLRCPWVGLVSDSLKEGFLESIRMTKGVDEWTVTLMYCEWKVFCCNLPPEVHREPLNPPSEGQAQNHNYWDIFVSRCIEEAGFLIQKKWVKIDDIQGADPSVILSIPAVTALKILVQSNMMEEIGNSDIVWGDGTVCNELTRPKDNITGLLWPKIMKLKRILAKDKEVVLTKENVDILTAMICSDGEEMTNELENFLQENKAHNLVANNRIRAMLVEMSLNLSRLQPMVVRMNKIFDHDYSALAV